MLISAAGQQSADRRFFIPSAAFGPLPPAPLLFLTIAYKNLAD